MAAFRGASAPASRRPNKPKRDTARVVVPFEDNRLLTQLLGEYDSHLALIEDRLGINAHAHGNVVILTGAANSCDIARGVLEKLYARITKGETIGAGDIDGLIRHSGPKTRRATGRRRLRRGAKSSRRGRRRKAPTSGRSTRRTLFSVLVRRARVRRTLPLRSQRTVSNAVSSNASSCRDRPSKPVSGLASCRATCATRLIPVQAALRRAL